MKIGFDAKRAFHNNRGLGNYARDLIEGLVEFYPEHQYYLYTPEYSKSKTLDWQAPSLAQVRNPSKFFCFFPSLWRSFYLGKEILSDDLHIYHGLSHELPWGIKKSGVHSLVTIHDLIAFRFPRMFPWFDRNIYVKKIAHACQAADVVVAICEQTKRDIVEYIGISEQKIKVLYQSIHPRFYNPPEEASAQKVLSQWGIEFPYILFVGALEERKNILNLIRAYYSIRQSKDYGLVLAGRDGGHQKKIETLVKKLRLENKVKILSEVGSDDLPSLYAGCTLFCYPSLFEGFGRPIAEASFCKKPVITSHGSCFPEAGGEGAVYIDPYDINSLADALETVLDDKEKQAEMARMGREHVEKFHRQKTTANLMQLYRDVAGK